MKLWVRKCDSFAAERQADREFWNQISPDERVAVVEELRQEWNQSAEESHEGLRRTVRVLERARG